MKLQGLNCENQGPKFKRSGPRVDLGKPQGLFSKNPGADQYGSGRVRCGALDLDRTALVRSGRERGPTTRLTGGGSLGATEVRRRHANPQLRWPRASGAGRVSKDTVRRSRRGGPSSGASAYGG